MGQITIYMDDDLEARIRAEAKALHISQSKLVAGLIREKIAQKWPPSIAKLAGAWKDLSTAKETRVSLGQDVSREEI